MKPAAFDYLRPSTLAEALAALAEAPDGKVIAGGQSLGPMLNLRLARPSLLIDIANLPELSRVEDRGGSWMVGAAVTHAGLEDGRIGRGGMIASVARGIAYRSVRNRGTLGGSLAHADPAADWPLALAALGATIHIRSGSAERQVAAAEFITAPFETALRDGELIRAVEIPKPSSRTRWGYVKLCGKAGEFAHASAAVVLDGEAGRFTAVVGALDGPPRALPRFAQRLSERPAAVQEDEARDALQEAGLGSDPIQLNLHAAALRRAVAQASVA